MKQLKKLTELRMKIDEVDHEVAHLLLKRFELADQILQLKIKLDLPIQDSQREQEILEGLSGGLTPCAYLEELLSVFRYILKVSCESMQKKKQGELR